MTPKFRAWDKVAEDIFIPEVLELDKYGKVTGIFSKGTMFSIEDFELLQSTGLKDINGKEIFEGDIVKVKAKDVEPKIHSDRYQIGMVVYTYGSFDIQTNDGTYTGLIPESNLTDILLTFEVLGNGFENPHLLGEDTQ